MSQKRYFEEIMKLLAVQIKLDIASTIRHHPHLTGEAAGRAYRVLANDDTIEQLVRELAQQEAAEITERGEVPTAALLHLGGYRVNVAAEC